MEEIKEDVKEIKADLKELIKQGAIHNVLLQTHEARSLALQKAQELQAAELKPIKTHVDFMNVLLKTSGAVLVGITIHALVKFFS